MDTQERLQKIGKIVLFETIFFKNILNFRRIMGLLLILYKYIKLHNRNDNAEKLKLMHFAAIWYFMRNSDTIIYGYLFTDDAHEAAFLGLLMPHLTYFSHLLYSSWLHFKKGQEIQTTNISTELTTFIENGFLKMMGIET